MSLQVPKRFTSSQVQSWLLIIAFYLIIGVLVANVVTTLIHGVHYTYVFQVGK
jgi:hypothetical protein